MFIIADLTRAFPLSELGLMESLFSACAAFPANRCQVICRPEQSEALQTVAAKCTLIPLESWDDTKVANFVYEKFIAPHLKGTLGANQLVVVSFSAPLLRFSTSIPVEQRSRFTFRHWLQIKSGAAITEETRAQKSYPFQVDPLQDFPISNEAIIAAIESTLSRVGHPLRASDLRTHLSVENPKFDKDVQPTAPGFVQAIIRLAEKADKITVDRTASTHNPTISLRKSLAIQTAPLGSAANGIGEGAAKPSEVASQRRSDVFFAILKRLDLGPFSIIRSQLYDAIQARAAEGKYTCNTLVRRSVDDVKPKFSGAKQPPWIFVTKFLLNLFSGRRVLLGQKDQPLSPREDMGCVVIGLAPEWREDADGALIEAIISEDRSVTHFDIPDLAAVVYNSRGEEAQTKVEGLLNRLLRLKRIQLDSSYRFKILAS